jgi:hypothetical protein
VVVCGCSFPNSPSARCCQRSTGLQSCSRTASVVPSPNQGSECGGLGNECRAGRGELLEGFRVNVEEVREGGLGDEVGVSR